jgi:hypothetical protein
MQNAGIYHTAAQLYVYSPNSTAVYPGGSAHGPRCTQDPHLLALRAQFNFCLLSEYVRCKTVKFEIYLLIDYEMIAVVTSRWRHSSVQYSFKKSFSST